MNRFHGNCNCIVWAASGVRAHVTEVKWSHNAVNVNLNAEPRDTRHIHLQLQLVLKTSSTGRGRQLHLTQYPCSVHPPSAHTTDTLALSASVIGAACGDCCYITIYNHSRFDTFCLPF